MNLIEQIYEEITLGNFENAEKLCEKQKIFINNISQKTDNTYLLLFNLAGQYIDLSHMSNNQECGQIGLNIMQENEEEFLKLVSASSYFYNLANAKTNMLTIINPFSLTFKNIEELVEIKNDYWKAIKSNIVEGNENLELQVNLANILKRQFRIVEALRYYDSVNSYNLDIPQAHVNRSESLLMLNTISESYTYKMMYEIIKGYLNASESKLIIPSWAEHYKSIALDLQYKLENDGIMITDEDHKTTMKEFNELSIQRQFYLENHLTLSEHSLYCPCVGSAKDNLTIPLTTKSIGGEFIPKMELILNRIKSEFSLARQNYYEYFYPMEKDEQLFDENALTDLLNSEALGVNIEKIRVSFRLCFGILDKIAIAICELYKIETTGNIYFHNFWKLDKDNRREKFERIKNPGLLALYSIATDLNEHKKGEWSAFKKYRNALEHGILVIVDDYENVDIFNSFSITSGVEKVHINEFLFF